MDNDIRDYISRIRELEIANYNAQYIIDQQKKKIEILEGIVDRANDVLEQCNTAIDVLMNRTKTLERVVDGSSK